MNLPAGPWETVFEAKGKDFDALFSSNPDSELVIHITEKQNQKPSGGILQLFKVFCLSRSPGELLDKMSFPAIVIGLPDPSGESHWFVLLDSGVTFVAADEAKVGAELVSLKGRLEKLEQSFVMLCQNMDLAVVPLAKAASEIRQSFFSSMLVSQLLVSKAKNRSPESQSTDASLVRFGEIKFGTSKEGEIVHEPLVLFKKTLVTGGSEAERNRVCTVLIESILLSGFPAIVLDSKKRFLGLREQNPNPTELKTSGFDLAPFGFPIEEFTVPAGIHANFSDLDIEAILELFGTGKSPYAKVIQLVFELKVAVNLSQLLEAIRIQSPGGDVTSYHIQKAMRVVALMDQHYPGFFGEPNAIESVSKTWETGIGRLAIVETDGLDARAKYILVHSLVRELKKFYKNKKKPVPVSAFLVLGQSEEFLPYRTDARIVRLIQQELAEAANVGIGVVAAAEKALDLDENFSRGCESEIGIVNQNDVGIRIEKRKPYRLRIRPTMSRPG